MTYAPDPYYACGWTSQQQHTTSAEPPQPEAAEASEPEAEEKPAPKTEPKKPARKRSR